ncbi:MAG: holo-ACP synthase [Porticoccaceae bacterium]|jgi:holo-[acyl-carrier protein] synthase
MALAIGTDIVEIERITATLERQGDKFIQRILCEPEQHEYYRRKQDAAYVAKRFAAKEAVAKALGTGIGRGVSFQDILIVNNDAGAPGVELSGGALQLMQSLGGSRMLLSLADEQQYALAYAVLI